MCTDSVASKLARYLAAVAVVLAAGAAPWVAARGEEFPSGNIKFVVNVAAGGVTDALARVVGQGLTERWGKPVFVENIVGGNFSIAARTITRAKPDGYTLLVSADAPFTAIPNLTKKWAFSMADYTPIGVICRPAAVLAVQKSLGVKTLQEFVALAKSRPGALSYGSQGVGTYGHLGMEDFKQRTGIDMVHVPYRGGAPALEGLVRGDVSALIVNYSNIAPFEQAGNVVILASVGDRRSEARPDLPTAGEQGVPHFSVSTWFGIFGPSGMSPELTAKIREGVEAALDSGKSADYFKINTCERIKIGPEEFRELIAADNKHWGELIRTLGVQID